MSKLYFKHDFIGSIQIVLKSDMAKHVKALKAKRNRKQTQIVGRRANHMATTMHFCTFFKRRKRNKTFMHIYCFTHRKIMTK